MAGEIEVPPAGCNHYESWHHVPDEIQKYYAQRYDIFSKYDEGIWLMDDAWYGVTPEPIARTVADHIAWAAPEDRSVLIDCFAGSGGNAIACALSGRWSQIFAIEKDPHVLRCAQHNAAIYGVANKILWIEGDCFDVLKSRLRSLAKKAVIFASPPWGGPGYSTDPVFNLSTMQPYSLETLCQAFSAYSRDYVLYLPRTSDLNQLARYVPAEIESMPVMHYCIRGASKALCAFYGDFKDMTDDQDINSA